MRRTEQALCAVAALLLIVPGLGPSLMGLALATPVLLRHLVAHRKARSPA